MGRAARPWSLGSPLAPQSLSLSLPEQLPVPPASDAPPAALLGPQISVGLRPKSNWARGYQRVSTARWWAVTGQPLGSDPDASVRVVAIGLHSTKLPQPKGAAHWVSTSASQAQALRLSQLWAAATDCQHQHASSTSASAGTSSIACQPPSRVSPFASSTFASSSCCFFLFLQTLLGAVTQPLQLPFLFSLCWEVASLVLLLARCSSIVPVVTAARSVTPSRSRLSSPRRGQAFQNTFSSTAATVPPPSSSQFCFTSLCHPAADPDSTSLPHKFASPSVSSLRRLQLAHHGGSHGVVQARGPG